MKTQDMTRKSYFYVLKKLSNMFAIDAQRTNHLKGLLISNF